MTKRKVIFIFLFLFAYAQTAFGYSDTTTHPALTSEIADFYNLNFEKNLTAEEKEWIIQGSMEEDTPPRWINHFLDPISSEGWTGEHTGVFSSSTLQAFSLVALFHENPAPADKWAHDQALQSKYGAYKGNRTWERALYAYVNGNKKDAYIALGHILHLIEDMTVPEHTRNDTHAHDLERITGDYGSPYEEYTKRYTRGNFHIADNLRAQGKLPYILDTLDAYFLSLAEYSNKYFFSKDTISDQKYQLPEVVREDRQFVYGIDKDGEEYPLAFIDSTSFIKKGKFEVKRSYKIEEGATYFPVLESYFQRLSREAVLAGAGVVNLFHKEAEYYKTHPEELPAPYKSESVIAFVKNRIPSPVGEGFRLAQFVQRATDAATRVVGAASETISALFPGKDLEEQGAAAGALAAADKQAGAVELENAARAAALLPQTTPNALEENSADATTVSGSPSRSFQDNPEDTGDSDESGNSTQDTAVQDEDSVQDTATTPPPAPAQVPSPIGIPPGAGGGAASPPEKSQPEKSIAQSDTILIDTTAPAAPIILNPQATSSVFTATLITFSGTAEASSTILNNLSGATTTAASTTSAWQLILTFPQGTSTISFFAKDAAGNQSTAATSTVFIDSQAPALDHFTVAECGNSLATSTCLVATTTLTVNQGSYSADAAEYLLDCTTSADAPCGASFPYTTSTATTTLSLADNQTITVSASVVDRYGNRSATSSKTVQIATLPVVVNEIAWAGTAESPADEWIELKNNTTQAISLDGWTLYSDTDAYPYIPLSGIVAPNGYFLIERQADDTISDIAADLTNNFGGSSSGNGLSNTTADILVLTHGSTTIERTVHCSTSNKWCGGATSDQTTVERRDPRVAASDLNNWGTNNRFVRNGKDKNGGLLNGTPKARNSLHYLIITDGSALSENTTLTKAKSPYTVPSGQVLTVAGGKTLTIEPGVVIKFGTDAGILVNGGIIAEGAAEERIVFTAFADDAHAGDTNADGACAPSDASSTAACPAAGAWKNIRVTQPTGTSTFAYATFRYGGKWVLAQDDLKPLLWLENATTSVTHSVFEYAQFYGLQAVNASATVTHNTFQHNTRGDQGGAGMAASSDRLFISQNSFTQNDTGLLVTSGAAPVVTGNTFASSTGYAIIISGAGGTYANNTGAKNNINGILLQNAIALANATTTLQSSGLAYVLASGAASPIVPASGGLRVESGAVVKGNSGGGLSVFGALQTAGTQASDVVFTALTDDTFGGDTDNASSTAQAGNWNGIFINGGRLEGRGFSVYYGGSPTGGGEDKGGVRVQNGTATIRNALFDNNYMHGLRALNATTTITDTIFQNHTMPSSSSQVSGLAAYGNAPVALDTVTFANNTLAVLADQTTLITGTNITFTNNTATTSPQGLFP